MSYEVLARKWRPQVFLDVIGQEHIAQTLINAIKTGRLAHAYLFGGPRGIGKTSVARILAKAINCKDGEPGIPCNKCRSCMGITDGSSTDVQEIDGASNRGIDDIRELRENVKYMPSSSQYRVYIIDEVHMLTLPAFNALLKTLEEPPAHVKFIFATTDTHKVPMTILSRCQRFDFKKIPPVKIVSHLKKIAEEENIEISKSGLALIANAADGCMRDAQSLLDQVISFAGDQVEDRHVIEILGIIDKEILFEVSRSIIEGDAVKCLAIVDRIYNHGHDIKEFYKTLMGHFRDLLVSTIGSETPLTNMNESEKAEAVGQAEQAGVERLQILLNLMLTREQNLRYASSPRLMLEALLVQLCRLDHYLSFGDLLIKIDALEKKLLGASGGTGQTRADSVSEPAAPWTPESTDIVELLNEETLTTSHNNNDNCEGWDDFLAFLKSKSRNMFNILKDWDFLNLTQHELEIAKGTLSFSAGYFDDKDRVAQLSLYCRDFFHRDIRVKIRENPNPVFKNSQPLKNENSVTENEKHGDFSQPVQDVLRIFQGEIKTKPQDN